MTLKSADDFRWYKAKIDLRDKYPYEHHGEPSGYPCKVESRYVDDLNHGAYQQFHSFTYQKKVVCESCGHATTVWPDDCADEPEDEE